MNKIYIFVMLRKMSLFSFCNYTTALILQVEILIYSSSYQLYILSILDKDKNKILWTKMTVLLTVLKVNLSISYQWLSLILAQIKDEYLNQTR